MRPLKLLTTLAAAVVATATAGSAAAEYPIAQSERPITLPKMTLAPELGFNVCRGICLAGFGVAVGKPPVFVGTSIGARFGIIDDLEVNATVVPLYFSPSVQYGFPVIGGTFRFLRGDFELGARLNFTILHSGTAGVLIEPGVPGRFHIGKRMRLDFGAYVPIYAAGGGAGGAGLRVPLEFDFNITESVHVGATTGVTIINFKVAGDTFAVPLGVVAGFAIPKGKAPLVDIGAYFRFPSFVTPAARAGLDKANPGLFETGLTGTLYLYL